MSRAADKELLDNLGAIAASRLTREAAEKIARELEDAKGYAKSIRAEAEADIRDTEQLRLANKREARKILDSANEKVKKGQARLDNQQRELTFKSKQLDEFEAELTSKEKDLLNKTDKLKIRQVQVEAESAHAQSIQARSRKVQEEINERLDRTRKIWQTST